MEKLSFHEKQTICNQQIIQITFILRTIHKMIKEDVYSPNISNWIPAQLYVDLFSVNQSIEICHALDANLKSEVLH